jgi:hypothetical protein
MIFIVFMLFGCSKPKELFVSPYYSESKVRNILLLSIEDDRSLENEYPGYQLEELLGEALKNRGYSVRTANETMFLMKKMGFTDNWINQINRNELCKIIGADGVLKTRIQDYLSQYKIFYRTDKLIMELSLLRCSNGEILWKNVIVEHNRSVGLALALVSPVKRWIKKAFRELPEVQEN